MTPSTTSYARPETQDIPKEQWTRFLAEFTRDNRGAHARLEVLGPEVGHLVETENKPFDGVSADVKDGESTVWIMFGSTTSDRLTHGVPYATTLWVLPPIPTMGASMQIEAADGTRTVLLLTRPEAYALPPGK